MGSGSMSQDQVRRAQQALQDKGYNVGGVDGIMGPRTASALRQFQQAQGMSASGQLDSQSMGALGLSADASSSMNRGTSGSSGMSSGSSSGASSGTTGSGSGASGTGASDTSNTRSPSSATTTSPNGSPGSAVPSAPGSGNRSNSK